MPQSNSKYIFLLFFLAVLVFSFLIILPFLDVILASAVVAYIFYPLFKLMKKKVKNENFATFLLVIIILIVFTVPSILAANAVVNEVSSMYQSSKESVITDIDATGCEGGSIQCFIVYLTSKVSSNPDLTEVIYSSMSEISKELFSKASSFVLSIPAILVDILIFLFLIYYFLRDGHKIIKYVHDVLPFRERFKHELGKKTEDMFYATIYGGILLALIQGVFAIIGYFIFGVNSPIFWGLLTGLASIIPVVGSGVIWVPLAISKIIEASIAGSNTPLWQGIGLIVYSALIVSTVDNFLKPYIVGHKAGLHPALVLLGIFGGILLIGAVGIIIGPLILAFAISLMDTYKHEKHVV